MFTHADLGGDGPACSVFYHFIHRRMMRDTKANAFYGIRKHRLSKLLLHLDLRRFNYRFEIDSIRVPVRMHALNSDALSLNKLFDETYEIQIRGKAFLTARRTQESRLENSIYR